MRLRPNCWVQIVESNDEEAAASVNMILHLVDVHDKTHDHDLDKVEELDRIAPGLLPPVGASDKLLDAITVAQQFQTTNERLDGK